MMFSTHILTGGSLGLLSLFFFPEYLFVAILAGMSGGFLPDVDMFWEHRKTFHRPYQFLILSLLTSFLVMFWSGQIMVALFFCFLSMALHSWMEIMSNGKTMRPYKNTDDRAVYNHLKSCWIKPRRIILVGSWRDIALTVVFGLILYHYVEQLRILTTLIMFWGVLYGLLGRKVKEIISQDYSRFSEFFQAKIGLGPDS